MKPICAFVSEVAGNGSSWLLPPIPLPAHHKSKCVLSQNGGVCVRLHWHNDTLLD